MLWHLPAFGNRPSVNHWRLADDAKIVLESFSKQKSHIIGHSLGGSIAQLFAVTYPETTASVVAISSPIIATGDVQFVQTDSTITEQLWSVLMANPMHQDVDLGLPEFQKIWRVLNGGWLLDEDMAEQYTRSIYLTELIGPAYNHTQVQSGIRDIFQELKETGTPLLLIHGDRDYLPADPENTKRLAQALPNAMFFALKNGGHMFFNNEIWNVLLARIHSHLSNAGSR